MRLKRLKERVQRRQSLINELFFTYRQLLRAFPRLIKRAKSHEVGGLMAQQEQVDNTTAERLWRVATEQGQAPQPCVCDEANTLLEDLQHTGDAVSTRRVAPSAMVVPLRAVRAFLLRAWSSLIETLTPNAHAISPEEQRFREEAKALQNEEADLHRQLVALRPENAPGEK